MHTLRQFRSFPIETQNARIFLALHIVHVLVMASCRLDVAHVVREVNRVVGETLTVLQMRPMIWITSFTLGSRPGNL